MTQNLAARIALARTAVGNNFKAAREAQGLTQAQAAERGGVSPGHYSRIERGLVDAHLTTLVGIGEALGLTAEDTFHGA